MLSELALSYDMAGMLGGVLFALWQGSRLDAAAKQRRFFADCMNNVGMAPELAAPGKAVKADMRLTLG